MKKPCGHDSRRALERKPRPLGAIEKKIWGIDGLDVFLFFVAVPSLILLDVSELAAASGAGWGRGDRWI